MTRGKAQINVEAGQGGRPWWWPAVELSGLVSVLFGAGYLLTGTWGFAEPAVHPLWLPVLLMAAQYGLGWGLTTAALCAAAAALRTGSAAEYQQLPLDRLEAVGPQGAAWLLAALIVGTLRDRTHRRAVEAESAMAELRTERDQIEADARAFRKAVEQTRRAPGRDPT